MAPDKVDNEYIQRIMQYADVSYGNKDGKLTKDEKTAIELFKSLVESDNTDKIIKSETYQAAMAEIAAIEQGQPSTLKSSEELTPSAKEGRTTNEVAFMKRRAELASVSDDELSKKFTITDTGISGSEKDHYLLHRFSMEEILKYDYLNKDMAEDKDGVLTARIKEENPNATDDEIKTMVDEEKALRAKRFNPDGTYNLQELADLVPGALGVDYVMNQSRNRQVYEGNKAAGLFATKLFPKGIDDFIDNRSHHSKKRAENWGLSTKGVDNLTKKLVTFFGGKVEGNQHKIATALKRIGGNGVPAAIGTGLAPFFFPANHKAVMQVFDIHAPGVTESYLDSIMDELLADMRNIKTDEGIEEYVANRFPGWSEYTYDEAIFNKQLINSLTNVGIALGVSVASAILKDIIIGEPREFETAVVGLAPFNIIDNEKEMTDVEAFKKAVDKNDFSFPKGTKETLKALADKFTYEDDCGNKKFDYEDMYGFLGAVAGNDSVLNATEFVDALTTQIGQKFLNAYLARMEYKKCCGGTVQTNTEVKPEEVAETKPEQKVTVKKDIIPGKLSADSKPKVLTMEYEVQPGDYWYGIADAFYPGLVAKLGYMGAIRALQKALATDENGNYDKQKYHNITHSTLKGQTKRAHGTILVLPPEIEGIKRKDDAVTDKKDFSKPQTQGNGTQKKTPGLDKAGVQISKTDVTTGIGEGSDSYTAKDGDSSARGKTREEAIQNLQKKTGKTYSESEIKDE